MAYGQVCHIAKLRDLSHSLSLSLSLYNNAPYGHNEEAPSTYDAEGLDHSCPT